LVWRSFPVRREVESDAGPDDAESEAAPTPSATAPRQRSAKTTKVSSSPKRRNTFAMGFINNANQHSEAGGHLDVGGSDRGGFVGTL
jgi:hypothetical protein